MARRRQRGRGRGRFEFWGPIPSYSRQTRRGGRVRVGGCCLPLALGLTAAPVVVAREVLRRH